MTENLTTENSSSRATRISDVVQRWVQNSPERIALVESSGAWTYGQLAAAISHTGDWLHELGVRQGDRVMIVGENCRAFVTILLAAAAIDAWPVLVNARLSPREIDQIRDHCGARRIFYTTSISPSAADHATRHAARVEERDGFGTVAVGPLNHAAQPEPLDENV